MLSYRIHSAQAGGHRLRLRIDFPAAYPMSKPQISMEDVGGTLDTKKLDDLRKKLIKVRFSPAPLTVIFLCLRPRDNSI